LFGQQNRMPQLFVQGSFSGSPFMSTVRANGAYLPQTELRKTMMRAA
jgi:hypothetical protein